LEKVGKTPRAGGLLAEELSIKPGPRKNRISRPEQRKRSIDPVSGLGRGVTGIGKIEREKVGANCEAARERRDRGGRKKWESQKPGFFHSAYLEKEQRRGA